jgi:hypothetical protein
VSQKRGLAVFFGCVIAIAVSYVATYPRFHPAPATTTVAANSPAAPASAATGLTTELPPLPLPLPAATGPLSWARLTPAQHAALAPFADQWDGFSDARKRKWLKIASRFAKLSPEGIIQTLTGGCRYRDIEQRKWLLLTADNRAEDGAAAINCGVLRRGVPNYRDAT